MSSIAKLPDVSLVRYTGIAVTDAFAKILNAIAEAFAFVFEIAVSDTAALDSRVTVEPPLCAFNTISASLFSPSWSPQMLPFTRSEP